MSDKNLNKLINEYKDKNKKVFRILIFFYKLIALMVIIENM